jgi:hypothetical protein
MEVAKSMSVNTDSVRCLSGSGSSSSSDGIYHEGDVFMVPTMITEMTMMRMMMMTMITIMIMTIKIMSILITMCIYLLSALICRVSELPRRSTALPPAWALPS